MYKVTVYQMGKTWDEVIEFTKYFKTKRLAQKFYDIMALEENTIDLEMSK